MPLFIKHRINRIADLDEVKPAWGVEIDLRSDVNGAGRLHLSHDPWKRGDDFERWLGVFVAKKIQGPLILNTKEDGLEERVLEMLAAARVTNYFFLDTALPTLVRWTGRGNRHFAVRLSSFEGPEGVRPFEGLADWVWVDCFEGKPLPAAAVAPLKSKFKMCLVSPELQGQPPQSISKFTELARVSDAICTNRPELWSVEA